MCSVCTFDFNTVLEIKTDRKGEREREGVGKLNSRLLVTGDKRLD